jgi:hypothetical protein
MTPSKLSVLGFVSLISSTLAFPLKVERSPVEARKAQYSVVNVDGSSGATSIFAVPQVVTQTVSITTALPTTFIATVNVDRGSSTETVYLTVTPTPVAAAPSEIASPPPFLMPPSGVFPPFNGSIVINGTSTTLPTASNTPCEENDAPSDGAPWHPHEPAPVAYTTRMPVPVGTGTIGYHHHPHPTAAYRTGAYPTAPVLPTGMTAPFPILPVETPHWFNRTQIPTYKKRTILS